MDDTTSHESESAAAAAEVVPRDGESAAWRGAVEDDAPTADAPGAHSEVPPTEPQLRPLVLQTELQPGGKTQYHVAELLQYHDRHFVESVYNVILGRGPDEAERALELAELRSGRASKVEIIERLSAEREEKQAGGASPGQQRRIRIVGLPSPAMRRLSRVPVLGYALRIVRALWRLPVLMQHQQQFEIYALAQQQLIADYLNQVLPQIMAGRVSHTTTSAPPQTDDVFDAVVMFSDALLDLSNSHAELQEQTRVQVEQTGVQVEQIEAALANLTQAITAQQRLGEEIKREQHALADAQQEFLIQEQRVIVETQKIVLEELRGQLLELSRRQESVRAELDVEARRLQALADGGVPSPPQSSGLR